MVFYRNYAFHNLILPPPSEDDLSHAKMSSFEHAVEHLIEEIPSQTEFIDNEISLRTILSLLARRYTAMSV